MEKKENIKYEKLPIINIGKIHKEENKDTKNSRIITEVFVFFIIILLLFCGYSMAKTIEQVIIKSNAQIAEPILIVENDPSTDITAEKKQGVYSFRIKNYDEKDNLTEADLKYYIEILSNIDNSVKIELFQGENKLELNNNKTEYIQISKEKKEEREYKIKIMYDKDKSTSISDIMEKIQVKVHTEQVKA